MRRFSVAFLVVVVFGALAIVVSNTHKVSSTWEGVKQDTGENVLTRKQGQDNEKPLGESLISEEGKCVDLDKDCFHFASQGECTKNPMWMLENCKVSCANCGSVCQDHNEKCQQWKKSGECRKNPKYMHTNCPKSCGTCENIPIAGTGRNSGDSEEL